MRAMRANTAFVGIFGLLFTGLFIGGVYPPLLYKLHQHTYTCLVLSRDNETVTLAPLSTTHEVHSIRLFRPPTSLATYVPCYSTDWVSLTPGTVDIPLGIVLPFIFTVCGLFFSLAFFVERLCRQYVCIHVEEAQLVELEETV